MCRRGRASALPPHLLRGARHRFDILARLLMALAVINLVLAHTLFPCVQGWVAKDHYNTPAMSPAPTNTQARPAARIRARAYTRFINSANPMPRA